jgi:hypothetical protein
VRGIAQRRDGVARRHGSTASRGGAAERLDGNVWRRGATGRPATEEVAA